MEVKSILIKDIRDLPYKIGPHIRIDVYGEILDTIVVELLRNFKVATAIPTIGPVIIVRK